MFLPLHPNDLSLQGRRIVLIRPGNRNPALTNFDDLAKIFLTSLDLLCEEEEKISIRGFEVVGDMTTLSFSHVAQMNPPSIKKLATIFQVFMLS